MTQSSIPTENFERDAFGAPVVGDDRAFKKLMTFVAQGDEEIKKNIDKQPLQALYELTTKKAQAFIKKYDLFRESNELSLHDLYKNELDITPSSRNAVGVQKSENPNLPPLPLVMNVDNKAFILEKYILDKQMCASLGQTLAEKQEMRVLALIDNKMSDEAAAELVKPIVKEKSNIEIFRYVKNQLGPSLINIIEKKFYLLGEDSLRELCLDGCKVSQKDLCQLLDVLVAVRSRLKYLSLAKVGLTETSIKPLCKIIANSEYLISLDISWNKMPAELSRKVIKRIAMNRSLRYLNLSWNSLTLQDNYNASSLKAFTRNNTNLVQLNLSHTDLTDFEATLILEGVSESRNVMSVHLAGNPISSKMHPALAKVLDAKKKIYTFIPPFNDKLDARIYISVQHGTHCKKYFIFVI